MIIRQVAADLNEVFKEVIGTYTNSEGQEVNTGIPLYKEDLSNFVDVGKQLGETTQWTDHYDKYVGKLIDRIGKVIIVDKSYESIGPDLVRDAFEYGAIIQKIRIKDVEFEETESWNLQAGEKYDYTEYKPVEFSETFFEIKSTFSVEWSWVTKQIKSAITNLKDFIALYAAIENRIKTKAKIAIDAMKMRLINAGNAANIMSGKNVVNFTAEYIKNTGDTSIKSKYGFSKKEYLRNIVVTLKKYKKFMSMPTKLFNLEGELNWTQNSLTMVGMTDLEAALEAYLESDTFHNEFTTFKGYSDVPAWQGITEGLDFDLRSSINVITPDTKEHCMYSGIVFTMFDRDGKVIYNEDPEENVAPFNPKGKFTNYYYSFDITQTLDRGENCITFVMSDYDIVNEEPADWGTGTYYTLNSETGEYDVIKEVGGSYPDFDDIGVVYRDLFAE